MYAIELQNNHPFCVTEKIAADNLRSCSRSVKCQGRFSCSTASAILTTYGSTILPRTTIGDAVFLIVHEVLCFIAAEGKEIARWQNNRLFSMDTELPQQDKPGVDSGL